LLLTRWNALAIRAAFCALAAAKRESVQAAAAVRRPPYQQARSMLQMAL
jgi:hypothetical protein